MKKIIHAWTKSSWPTLVAAMAFVSAWSIPSTSARAQDFYFSTDGGNIESTTPSGTVGMFYQFVGSSAPQGVAFGPNGDLYVAQSYQYEGTYSNEIDAITPAGGESKFVSLPSGSTPSALAFDQAGNLYVTGSNSVAGDTILKITPSGGISTYATLPTGSSPDGLAFDASGNLYAADYSDDQISKITKDGTVTEFAALPASSGAVQLAFFDGNLYSVDSTKDQISKISSAGTVTEYASLDSATGSTETSEVYPLGLAFDPNGDLYVTADGGAIYAYNSPAIFEIGPNGDSVTEIANAAEDPLLDDPGYITYENVPEPTGYAFLLAGLIGIGLFRNFRGGIRPF